MTVEKRVINLPHGFLRIESHLDVLKPAERKVAEYILKNISETIQLSITKLSERVGVSEATIVKFCQHIGYSGYQELKIMLAKSSEDKQGERIYGPIEANDSPEIILEKIFQIYDYSFKNTKKILQNSDLVGCINLILRSKRIFFYGFGASGIVALDAEQKFKRIDYIAEAIIDSHSQKTVGAILKEGDLILAISDSGRTRELIESLKVVKETPAKIIGITSNMGSPLTKLADITLLTTSKETPFRGSALASRMAQLTVIDVLFLGVATSRYDHTISALNKTRIALSGNKID